MEEAGRRNQTGKKRKTGKDDSTRTQTPKERVVWIPLLASEDPNESSSAMVCASRFHVLEAWSPVEQD